MARRRGKTDLNQPQIVKDLRCIGATVQSLANIGEGCPDLLIGFRGMNYLIELKNENMPPSKQRITSDEKKWHENWRGQVAVANNIWKILKIIGAQQ